LRWCGPAKGSRHTRDVRHNGCSAVLWILCATPILRDQESQPWRTVFRSYLFRRAAARSSGDVSGTGKKGRSGFGGLRNAAPILERLELAVELRLDRPVMKLFHRLLHPRRKGIHITQGKTFG
jgi:hypothetical protein